MQQGLRQAQHAGALSAGSVESGQGAPMHMAPEHFEDHLQPCAESHEGSSIKHLRQGLVSCHVRTSGPIPERGVCPHEDGVDEAGGVHWNIEEVSFLWVQCAVGALQQMLMQQHLYAVRPVGQGSVVEVSESAPGARVLHGYTDVGKPHQLSKPALVQHHGPTLRMYLFLRAVLQSSAMIAGLQFITHASMGEIV